MDHLSQQKNEITFVIVLVFDEQVDRHLLHFVTMVLNQIQQNVHILFILLFDL